MLKDLLIITSLFIWSDSWILFFITTCMYKMFFYFDKYINSIVNSDVFISNNVDQDDNKCNTLDDIFKAYSDSGFDKYQILNYTYKPLKKYIVYPIEYNFCRLEILYIPQLYEKVDLYLKERCVLCVLYIRNLDCSKKIKRRIISYIMYIIQEYFRHIIKTQGKHMNKLD